MRPRSMRRRDRTAQRAFAFDAKPQAADRKSAPEIGSIQRSGEDPAKRDFLLENNRRYKEETKSHGEGAVWGRDHSASGGIENAVAIDDPIRESFGEPTEPGRRAGRTLRS